jgi:hypothetical protein
MDGNRPISIADSDQLPAIAQGVYIWDFSNPQKPATLLLGWTGDCRETFGRLIYRLEDLREGQQEPIWRSLDQIYLTNPMDVLRSLRGSFGTCPSFAQIGTEPPVDKELDQMQSD